MFIRSLILFCTLISAHSVAGQDTGEEVEIIEMNSAILRATFADERIKATQVD